MNPAQADHTSRHPVQSSCRFQQIDCGVQEPNPEQQEGGDQEHTRPLDQPPPVSYLWQTVHTRITVTIHLEPQLVRHPAQGQFVQLGPRWAAILVPAGHPVVERFRCLYFLGGDRHPIAGSTLQRDR
jgi:hypothetical protein